MIGFTENLIWGLVRSLPQFKERDSDGIVKEFISDGEEIAITAVVHGETLQIIASDKGSYSLVTIFDNKNDVVKSLPVESWMHRDIQACIRGEMDNVLRLNS